MLIEQAGLLINNPYFYRQVENMLHNLRATVYTKKVYFITDLVLVTQGA